MIWQVHELVPLGPKKALQLCRQDLGRAQRQELPAAFTHSCQRGTSHKCTCNLTIPLS